MNSSSTEAQGDSTNSSSADPSSFTERAAATPLWLTLGRWLLVTLPLALFWLAGDAGIDFGKHWDEGHRVVDYSKAARSQTLLPTAYNYPSMTFVVGMVAYGPKFVETSHLDREEPEFKKAVTEYIGSSEFILRVRRHFLLLSAASILWVFAALMAWGRSWVEALFAAFWMACSFELNYHARWIAPDAITMQFVAFTAVALVAAHKRPESMRWLVMAAIGLGLATSTKYLAAVLAVPIVCLLLLRGASWRSYLGLGALSVAVFFVITPGALIQPTRFVEDLLYEQAHYSFGHFGFTVEAGLDHFARSLRYLTFHGPSSELWIATILSILGVLGLLAMIRESKSLALVLCVVPLIYLAMISMQRVMFVRNLLFVMPFCALFSARGFGLLMAWLRRPVARGVLAAAALAMFTISGYGLVEAGRKVRDYSLEMQLTDIQDYLRAHPETSFQLSPVVAQRLSRGDFESLPNTSSEPTGSSESEGGAEFLVTYQVELLEQGYWPSNDPRLFERAFGPPSANYDYYSTWPRSVVVVLERAKAREIAGVYPPKGIDKIFSDLRKGKVPNIPEGQKPSPHSKFKPGHRGEAAKKKQKDAGSEGESSSPKDPADPEGASSGKEPPSSSKSEGSTGPDSVETDSSGTDAAGAESEGTSPAGSPSAED